MTTAGQPEAGKARSGVHRGNEAYRESALMCEDLVADRNGLFMYDFHECVLPGEADFSRWRPFLSCKRNIFLLLSFVSIT